jgi:hypothetical protein
MARVGKANRKETWEFLEEVLAAVPYKIHTITMASTSQSSLVTGTQ